MDEGIIIRSIYSIILKLKHYYDNSITTRVVGAISSFFKNLADGSGIVTYFRKYDMKSPLITYSIFSKATDAAAAKLKNAAGTLSDFILGLFKGSRVITFYHASFRKIESNLLKSVGIFIGTASAAYLAASMLGGDLSTARLITCLSIVVFSTVLMLLPFDIRKASEESIFCRLVKYIFS